MKLAKSSLPRPVFESKMRPGIFRSLLFFFFLISGFFVFPNKGKAQVDPNKVYYIEPRHASRVLSINQATLDQGGFMGPLVLRNVLNRDYQKWKFIPYGDGTYYIQNLNGTIIATIWDSKDPGTAIWTWKNDNVIQQRFRLVPQPDGYFSIISAFNGLALDINNARADEGADVIQWTPHNGANQQFALNPVGQSNFVLPDRVYSIESFCGKILTAAPGDHVTQVFPFYGKQQLWTFMDAGAGYFVITNYETKGVLTVNAFSADAGQHTEFKPYDSHNAQKWLIESVAPGKYKLTPKNCPFSLTVAGANENDLGRVAIWPFENGKYQIWEIKEPQNVADAISFHNIYRYGMTIIQDGGEGLGDMGHGFSLYGDYDGNKIPEFFFIKNIGTGSNSVEVHIQDPLAGKWVLHTATPCPVQRESSIFQLGDYDHDGRDDLFIICTEKTGTHTIEVHVLSAASNYQTWILQTGTPLPEGGDTYRIMDYNQNGTVDLVPCMISSDKISLGEYYSGESNFQTKIDLF